MLAAGLCSSAGECGPLARGAPVKALCACAARPSSAVLLLHCEGATLDVHQHAFHAVDRML